MTIFDNLQQFRQTAYNLLGKAKDATFELMDAVILTKDVSSYPELSRCPVFRRGWSSIYEAIKDTRPDSTKLMELYIAQMSAMERPLLAGDHTPRPRPEAKTLCDRSYVHSTGKTIGNKPVIPGHDYSTIAWIPEEKGSWALPLTHERITSFDTPISKAAAQLELVCQLLPTRPITVWDSEYGCASFVVQTAHIRADKLMRLRPNRCLWGVPPKTNLDLGRNLCVQNK